MKGLIIWQMVGGKLHWNSEVHRCWNSKIVSTEKMTFFHLSSYDQTNLQELVQLQELYFDQRVRWLKF
jgi:hypothetical protein